MRSIYISNILSSLFGKLCLIKWPFYLKYLILSFFKRLFKINLTDSLQPFTHFQSINDMFTRELKPESRQWSSHSMDICSPVDGVLKEIYSNQSRPFSVKHFYYTIPKLIGTKPIIPANQSVLFNFYLSPKDCHRIFAPCDFNVVKVDYIPGKLLPVSPLFVKFCPNVFSINERIVMTVEYKSNQIFYIVLVGALNVGSMTLTCLPNFITNKDQQISQSFTDFSQTQFKKGDHIGTFNLGSSVLLLFDENHISYESMSNPYPVCYGNVFSKFR